MLLGNAGKVSIVIATDKALAYGQAIAEMRVSHTFGDAQEDGGTLSLVNVSYSKVKRFMRRFVGTKFDTLRGCSGGITGVFYKSWKLFISVCTTSAAPWMTAEALPPMDTPTDRSGTDGKNAHFISEETEL